MAVRKGYMFLAKLWYLLGAFPPILLSNLRAALEVLVRVFFSWKVYLLCWSIGNSSSVFRGHGSSAYIVARVPNVAFHCVTSQYQASRALGRIIDKSHVQHASGTPHVFFEHLISSTLSKPFQYPALQPAETTS